MMNIAEGLELSKEFPGVDVDELIRRLFAR
jgi:hypothetical protein